MKAELDGVAPCAGNRAPRAPRGAVARLVGQVPV